MSGALAIVATLRNTSRFSVPVVDLGSGLFGTSSLGESFKGQAIEVISSSNTGANDFDITLQGILPRGFFLSVLVQASNDSLRFYSTAAAAFTQDGIGGLTTWAWGFGAGTPAWTEAETRFVILQY